MYDLVVVSEKIGFLISGASSEFKNRNNFDKIYPVPDLECKQQR